MNDRTTQIAIVAVLTILIIALFARTALRWYRRYENAAARRLTTIYSTYDVHQVPEAGDVELVFHTYHGLLAWFTQIEHRVYAPPDRARNVLGRFLKFNLTWGILTYGAIFVPVLSLISYFEQRRSIRRQEQRLG